MQSFANNCIDKCLTSSTTSQSLVSMFHLQEGHVILQLQLTFPFKSLALAHTQAHVNTNKFTMPLLVSIVLKFSYQQHVQKVGLPTAGDLQVEEVCYKYRSETIKTNLKRGHKLTCVKHKRLRHSQCI